MDNSVKINVTGITLIKIIDNKIIGTEVICN